ncbi:unnamed protein product [Ceratitis capitata]|uniref:(Mediterranean fruit fly) hypothetical protein n=1 Tax=Ceratitis capitata TaxID=7213 RepID=A0A811V915_CERCA|nr:unnamed protein product [Ceratitis capitata]CAD7011444.1 unnamed protein product [Ceratitis capitata]
MPHVEVVDGTMKLDIFSADPHPDVAARVRLEYSVQKDVISGGCATNSADSKSTQGTRDNVATKAATTIHT